MVTNNIPKKLNLEQFRGGTEKYYRHSLTGGVFTDGVKYVADVAGAYWLLDMIFLAQQAIDKVLGDFQVWEFLVSKNKRARLICHDGNGQKLYSNRIPWTDFPARRLTLWFGGGDRCLYLPEEH